MAKTRKSPCQMCRIGRKVGIPLCRRHLTIITADEYRRETAWLTPAQVVAMKADGRLPR
jgi:hypothetical protein